MLTDHYNYSFEIKNFFESGPHGRFVTRAEFDDFWRSLTNEEILFYQKADLS